MVNAAHSIVQIASGAVFLFASMAGAGAAQLWFKIFGLIYAVVAVLGFMTPNGMLLGMISNNPADTWLHVVLAAAIVADRLRVAENGRGLTASKQFQPLRG